MHGHADKKMQEERDHKGTQGEDRNRYSKAVLPKALPVIN